jgi:hypothetical protein
MCIAVGATQSFLRMQRLVFSRQKRIHVKFIVIKLPHKSCALLWRVSVHSSSSINNAALCRAVVDGGAAIASKGVGGGQLHGNTLTRLFFSCTHSSLRVTERTDRTAKQAAIAGREEENAARERHIGEQQLGTRRSVAPTAARHGHISIAATELTPSVNRKRRQRRALSANLIRSSYCVAMSLTSSICNTVEPRSTSFLSASSPSAMPRPQTAKSDCQKQVRKCDWIRAK